MLEQEQLLEQVSCSSWLYLHTCSHTLDRKLEELYTRYQILCILPEKQPSSSASGAAVLPRAGGHTVHLLEVADEDPAGGCA